MRITNRFEYKYVLDLRTYFAFKNRLSMFMNKGQYTKIAENNQYFVRSLYYDTYDYRHYIESEEGQYGRIKCRVRTYESSKDKTNIISIEIKTKHGSIVKKYSELITLKEYLYFLENGHFNSSSTVLDEFTRMIRLQHLEPKMIVEYEREGYVPKEGSDLRVTFDHHVRSAKSKTLYDDSIVHMRKHSHDIVCEIKCGMKKPEWLEIMIKSYGLKMIGNSKYVQAVERIYPSIITKNEYLPITKKITTGDAL